MSVATRLLKRISSKFRRQSFALNKLNLKLERYLDFDHGFFIEAGANDGVRQSNTLYFERYRGWRGLLVEPVPELAEHCRRNRPHCLVENTALVADDYEGSTVEMRFCNLMSLVKGGMKSIEEEDEHIRSGCDCQQIETRELTVPACTLSDLLDRHQITQVDLLSLDVEGFELPALRGLDFQRHAPRFLLIEVCYREDIESYLSSWYAPLAELSYHDVLYRQLISQ
jgi:FkbM family methyltransferase